ncbi:uncharacterized protein PG986_010077 [Apiospora aurea]|uniref:Uncharacterized protein n=1 Tax=Apiospora aurea TaxID=335848 RepID=A0ABR1Q9F9_9PEZI
MPPPRAHIVRLRAAAAGMQKQTSSQLLLLPRHRYHHDNPLNAGCGGTTFQHGGGTSKDGPRVEYILGFLEQRKRPNDPATYVLSSSDIIRQFAALGRIAPPPRSGYGSSSRHRGHKRDFPSPDACRQYTYAMRKYSYRLDFFIKPYEGPWEAAAKMDSLDAAHPACRSGDIGAFNLAYLQWCPGENLIWARLHLLDYWRQLHIRQSGNSRESIERAKARFAANKAAWRVYKWIYATRSVRHWFEQNLDSGPLARDCLSVAIEIIVGAGKQHWIEQWLSSSARGDHESDEASHRRLTLRCHLFVGTARAIRRWASEEGTHDAFSFLTQCLIGLERHVDIAPLLVREVQSLKSESAGHDLGNFRVLLRDVELDLLLMRHRVELEVAAFDLYHGGPQSSPLEFRKLLRALNRNHRKSRRVSFHEFVRMNRLARRCFELFVESGDSRSGLEVEIWMENVYDTGYFRRPKFATEPLSR